jgi:acyl-CoA synthetase (NDP forming)
MSRTTIPWLLPTLAAFLLCAAVPTRAATRADPRLDGDWQFDPSASDDFDAKLTRMAEELRAKRRNRRSALASRGGPGGYGATDEFGQVPGLVQELPPETHDELRDRLGDTYRPPAHLHIQSHDDVISMLGDAPPERRYSLAETVTRMDVSGTSTLSTNWSGSSLVVDARYTNRARSEQRYGVDRTGSVLTVTLKLTDPIGGKLQLHSTYRRVATPAAH